MCLQHSSSTQITLASSIHTKENIWVSRRHALADHHKVSLVSDIQRHLLGLDVGM
jgi:hypothetical protein